MIKSFKFALEKCKTKSKYCNENIFQLIKFCDCRIPNQQPYLCKILSLQKIDWTACLYTLYSSVYLTRFSNCIQLFPWQHVLIIGTLWINRSSLWRCSAKIQKQRHRGILQESVTGKLSLGRLPPTNPPRVRARV